MSVTSSWWLLQLRGSRILEQSPSFHPHQAACVRSLRGFSHSRRTSGYCVAISCSSAFLAFVLGVFCRNMFGAGAMYASWFAAAAACRVREFVAVEASVDSSRFDVVPGIAVAASEEYTVSFIVKCVYLVTEGDHYGVVADVVQGASCNQYSGW